MSISSVIVTALEAIYLPYLLASVLLFGLIGVIAISAIAFTGMFGVRDDPSHNKTHK